MSQNELISKAGIAKNFIYNLLYQIFSLITPFITAPYLSRVLGSAGIGSYSFSYTISNYFILIGSLGFIYYAQREIATLQGDRKAQSILFWEIVIARFASIGIALIIYVGLILSNLLYDYNVLLTLLTITIFGAALDITFLFQGNDRFGIIAIRNIVIRTIGIILIFVFVKNEEDLWLFVLLQAIIGIISNLSLWSKISDHVDRVELMQLHPQKHFIPTLKLFIPTVAMSVYTMLDRTLIGILIPGNKEVLTSTGILVIKKIADIENGYYEQSEKIVKMAMTLFTSLSTVLISRNSNDLAKGDFESFTGNLYLAIKVLFFIGMPTMFGLAAIAENFTPWFFGPGYDKVPYLIMIFSPITMIIGLSNILGRQYLIPQKRDNEFTIAICVGAGINLIFNLVLIPSLQSYGAAIASVVAEIMVTLVMFIQTRNDIDVIEPMRSCWNEVVSAILMFIIIYFTQKQLPTNLINTVLLVICEAFLYLGVLYLLEDETLFSLNRLIRNTLKRRRKNG